MNSKQLSWIIRREAIEMTNHSGASHIASILSVSDIVAVLTNDIAHLDPNNLKNESRDRIILSKGHAGASLYICLSLLGFFNPSILRTYEDDGSILSGHVSHKTVPGIEFSTGSLGHGLSVGSGMAYGLKEKGMEVFFFNLSTASSKKSMFFSCDILLTDVKRNSPF